MSTDYLPTLTEAELDDADQIAAVYHHFSCLDELGYWGLRESSVRMMRREEEAVVADAMERSILERE